MQIAAVPSRAEPDEGEVNYRTILAELDRLGYAGWIGCEYKPRGRTEDGLVYGSSEEFLLAEKDELMRAYAARESRAAKRAA